MKKILKTLTPPLVSLIGLCLLAIIAGAGSAAGAPASGITLSPASEQLTINQGEASHEINFKITNNFPSAQSLQISSADFNALEDTGGLIFVGANPTALQKKYGLARWLNIPQSNLTIPARQTVEVKAQVLNLPTLSPGGHYGAILLHVAGDSSHAGSKNNIGLNPIGSILLFVNKAGGDLHRLKLAEVDSQHRPWRLPDSVDLRFYNNGNTHLTPRGVVTITDPDGKLVSRGIINRDSNVILPEVYRRYPVELTKVAGATKPGKYKLSVAFRFDGLEQFRLYQTSFLFLTPAGLVIIGLISLVLIVLLVYLFRKPTWRSRVRRLLRRQK